jgi:hypothetical protein
MKKLPARMYQYVLPFVMTGLLTSVVCAVSPFRVAGLIGLEEKWFSIWLITWAIAFPTLVIIMPLVKLIVSSIVEVPGPGDR